MSQSDVSVTKPSLRKQALIALVILVTGFAGYSFLVKSKPEATPSAVEERSWNVSTLRVSPGAYNPIIQIYGQVTTQMNSEITATVDAYIDNVAVSEGEEIHQYQTLVSLDRSDIELTYQQQLGARNAINAEIDAEKVRYEADLKAIENERALVALTRRTVERYRSLKGKNLSSEIQLEEAERSYQQQLLSLNSRQTEINEHPSRLAKLEANQLQAQAALDKAILDLDRTQITAPFDGRVSEVLVSPGERTNQGTPLVRIYSTNALELKGQIPSRYLPVIRQALANEQSVSATTTVDGASYEFKLDRLASEIRSGQGGVFGFFHLDSKSTQLELGRSFELELQLPSVKNAILIPPQALYGTHRVYKVGDNRLIAVDIERLGEAIDDEKLGILIKSDALQKDDLLITTQLPTAVNGLKVNLIGSTTP